MDFLKYFLSSKVFLKSETVLFIKSFIIYSSVFQLFVPKNNGFPQKTWGSLKSYFIEQYVYFFSFPRSDLVFLLFTLHCNHQGDPRIRGLLLQPEGLVKGPLLGRRQTAEAAGPEEGDRASDEEREPDPRLVFLGQARGGPGVAGLGLERGLVGRRCGGMG